MLFWGFWRRTPSETNYADRFENPWNTEDHAVFVAKNCSDSQNFTLLQWFSDFLKPFKYRQKFSKIL